jgi:uncharacterized protein (DUF305 family)
MTDTSVTDADDGGRDDDAPGPRPTLSWARIVALVAVFAFFGGAVGYFVATPRKASASSVDSGFRYDMISHHVQAVDMSMIALDHITDPTILSFAKEILEYQSYEIGLMEQGLREDGLSVYARPETAMGWMGMDPMDPQSMPGMATATQLQQLRDATGQDAEVLFLELMTTHHRGGINMAEYAAAHAKGQALRAFAESMARNQAIEINEMSAAAKQLGLPADLPDHVSVPPPAGASGSGTNRPDGHADRPGMSDMDMTG